MAFGSGPPPGGGGRGGGEGVRTRDHLANVRTYLAWTRGGLALVAIGYVIDKFELIVTAVHRGSVTIPRTAERAVSLTVVTLGVLLALGAYGRYQVARRTIEGAALRARPLLDMALTVVAASAGFVILGYLARIGG